MEFTLLCAFVYIMYNIHVECLERERNETGMARGREGGKESERENRFKAGHPKNLMS